MILDEFVHINSELVKRTGLALYRSESYAHPFVQVSGQDRSSWMPNGMRALCLLIGGSESEGQILGCRQSDIKRPNRTGFISIEYGGDDEQAIGASHYGADTSPASKLANRELNKILKRQAHKGVLDAAGNYIKEYYWTDAALNSGKNWHFIRHSGYPSTAPGYRPAPAGDVDGIPKCSKRN